MENESNILNFFNVVYHDLEKHFFIFIFHVNQKGANQCVGLVQGENLRAEFQCSGLTNAKI